MIQIWIILLPRRGAVLQYNSAVFRGYLTTYLGGRAV